jgi:hypothetical protein
MWKTETSAMTQASAATIWRLYTDLPNWNKWDDGIQASHLDGDFVVGARGWLHPVGAPKALDFVLTEVVPLELFADQTELPGASLLFTHRLENTGSGGTQITHQVSIVGAAWQQYADGLGHELEQNLPKTVAKLAVLAAQLEQAA